MKILFIGDTFGKAGRRAVKSYLQNLRKQSKADIVLLNAENLAGGKSTSEKTLLEMEQAGVDFFTGGNHSFHDLSIYESGRANLVRPANMEAEAPGVGYRIMEAGGEKIGIVNLLGRVFLKLPVTCPFRKMEEILREWESEPLDSIFVDLHAESTSEKMAFFQYFRGKVTAIVGTHTHVPTADARIWPDGTFYQTDIGMTGPVNSVIGLQTESGIENFLSAVGRKKFVPETGSAVFRALLLDMHAKKTQNFNTYEYFEDSI